MTNDPLMPKKVGGCAVADKFHHTLQRADAGLVPESWCCVDCGVNTAPGLSTRAEMEFAFNILRQESIEQTYNSRSEVYFVRAAVWKRAGMEEFGGCLCIGCLESRLGRRLKPKDFQRDHELNMMPGTPRLLQRQKRDERPEFEANAHCCTGDEE